MAVRSYPENPRRGEVTKGGHRLDRYTLKFYYRALGNCSLNVKNPMLVLSTRSPLMLELAVANVIPKCFV